MSFTEKIATLKIYLQRAMVYGSVINFLLVAGAFVKIFNIQISFWILSPIILIVSVIVGYIDVEVLKLFKYEFDITKVHNQINEIKEDLELIKKKLVIK